MLDQSLKIAVDPFFGANENQYQMNHEFVATEVKYHLVFEETIHNIKSTPFEREGVVHIPQDDQQFDKTLAVDEKLIAESIHQLDQQEEDDADGSKMKI